MKRLSVTGIIATHDLELAKLEDDSLIGFRIGVLRSLFLIKIDSPIKSNEVFLRI